MLLESELMPFSVSPPIGEKVLVLAPHPDDETLGCGGTIRLLVEAGKKVRIVFLTSGDKAEDAENNKGYSLMREKEAEKALRVLGVTEYDFLRFPDRELAAHYEAVQYKIEQAMKAFMPDAVYCPSMVEINPDHRTTDEVMLEIQKSLCVRDAETESTKVILYEVTTPLRPNLLVDISSTFRQKKRAVKKYRSQLRLIDYLQYTTALNTFRSLTVVGPQFVEAFWMFSMPLQNDPVQEWMAYRTPLENT